MLVGPSRRGAAGSLRPAWLAALHGKVVKEAQARAEEAALQRLLGGVSRAVDAGPVRPPMYLRWLPRATQAVPALPHNHRQHRPKSVCALAISS